MKNHISHIFLLGGLNMIQCKICGQKIQNRQALEMHKKWKHSETLESNILEIKGDANIEETEKETFECGKCGSDIEEDQNFCIECGSKLNWSRA